MSVKVLTVFYVVLCWCRPNVAFLVPVSFDATVNASHQHVVANIEFSFLVKQGFLNVLLQNICSETSIAVFLFWFQSYLYLIQSGANWDSFAPVCDFSWFDNPDISDIWVFVFQSFLVDGIVAINKFIKLRIFESPTDMKSQGNKIKGILSIKFVVLSHSVKESFFVANKVITLEMVVGFLLWG
jgi:hypothetical protein